MWLAVYHSPGVFLPVYIRRFAIDRSSRVRSSATLPISPKLGAH